MNKLGRVLIAAVFAGALALLNGCSDDGGGAPPSTAAGNTGGAGGGTVASPPPTLGAGCGTSGTDVLCVNLTSTASSLPADSSSTTTLTATLTRNGSALQGVILEFTVSNSAMGTLIAASGVTNSAGVVTTTFQAGGTQGAVAITVRHAASNASTSLALSMTQAPGATPAGVQFVSAAPSVIGIVGSGQPTTSTVTFNVTDASSGPVRNQLVNFSLIGPIGAYIGTVDGTPNTASGTTNSTGNVSVPLNAGNVAGPVTITATVTVGGTTFVSSTSVISIGGGVPSAGHFTIATERFNLPGLLRAGVETNLSVFVADRFSNYNILAGTQVSFFTEAGAVDRSVNLSASGAGTVTFRTQAPMPYAVPNTHPFFPNARGWVTVIAVTRGEEEFADINGNGVYDPGVDTLTTAMDLGEPFVDSNDNGVWDGPNCNAPAPGPNQTGCDPTHPGEFFVDTNVNRQYDGRNGVWDGPGCAQAGCHTSPNIWTSIRLQFTGEVTCTVTPQFGWTIPNGGAINFVITVADVNNNPPGPGFSIDGIVMNNSSGGRSDIGTGNISIESRDGISTGPFTYTFTIADGSSFLGFDSVGFRIEFESTEIPNCVALVGAGIQN